MSNTESIAQDVATRRDVWDFIATTAAGDGNLPAPSCLRLHVYEGRPPIVVLEFESIEEVDAWGQWLDCERSGPVEHDHQGYQWTEVRWWDQRLGWMWQLVGRVDRDAAGGAE